MTRRATSAATHCSAAFKAALWPVKESRFENAGVYQHALTITGLKSGLRVNDDGTIDGIFVDDFGTVWLSADVLGTTTVKLTGDYLLALEDDYEPTSETRLSLNGTTATVAQITTAGYTLSDDEQTITFTPESTTTLATISGLKHGLTLEDAEAGISVEDDVITLSADVLATTKVNLKGNYTLELAGDVITEGEDLEQWTVSGSAASLKIGTGSYYNLAANGKSISFVPARLNKTLVTIKGLRKGLTVNDDGFIDGIDFDGQTATVAADVLGVVGKLSYARRRTFGRHGWRPNRR